MKLTNIEEQEFGYSLIKRNALKAYLKRTSEDHRGRFYGSKEYAEALKFYKEKRKAFVKRK